MCTFEYMKNKILLTLSFALVLFSCKKDNEPAPVAPLAMAVTPKNDPALLGKWYLDSTLSPVMSDKVYYADRICGPQSSVSYVVFTSTIMNDYNCVFGTQMSIESDYTTLNGYINSNTDPIRYSYNGKVLLMVESYAVTEDETDSIYSWYSR